MKKSIYFLFVFIALILLSCKKESNTQNPSNVGASNNTGITSSNATSWYGIFQVSKLQSISGGTLTTEYAAQVYLSSSPQQYDNSATVVLVDSVKLNGAPLEYIAPDYIDTVGFSTGVQPPLTYPYTYKVVGKNGIPSFTYTENGPFPAYTGYVNLPDTIHRSAGVTISLAGISNADNVIVNIVQGTHEPSQVLYNPFPTNVTFTSATLSALDTTTSMTPARIEVILIKLDNKSVNGKPMAFNMGYSFIKNITIK